MRALRAHFFRGTPPVGRRSKLMTLPDLRTLAFAPDVLPDPSASPGRIVLWVRGAREGRSVTWTRVSNVNGAEIRVVGNIASVPASVMSARQCGRGVLAQLRRWPRSDASRHELLLPTGETAERIGDRMTDVCLAWSTESSVPLDVCLVTSIWPDCRKARPLGKNLFVIEGVEERPAPSVAVRGVGRDVPLRDRAESMLAASRQSGDVHAQVLALTDLGIFLTEQGEPRSAIQVLEEALSLTRSLGDRTREADVLSNLGLPVLADRQSERALKLFHEAEAVARESGNVLTEKVTLERLGLAYAAMEDPERSSAYFERALALAQTVGDRPHQATLCWNLAINHAELGDRDRAITEGERAIAILTAIGKPEAPAFVEHLAQFRRQSSDRYLTAIAGLETLLAAPIHASTAVLQQPPTKEMHEEGPSLLRMALSAAKSLAKFACNRFKTVPAEVHRQRIDICAECNDHTGLRCLVCGCFTDAKARLPHEVCPRGKWPDFVPTPLPSVAAMATAK
jgi:tetratricopeptide (TPR) repeat protein